MKIKLFLISLLFFLTTLNYVKSEYIVNIVGVWEGENNSYSKEKKEKLLWFIHIRKKVWKNQAVCRF